MIAAGHTRGPLTAPEPLEALPADVLPDVVQLPAELRRRSRNSSPTTASGQRGTGAIAEARGSRGRGITPTEMILPGEIYLADIPPGQRHAVVVVSREELNRGDYVVAALHHLAAVRGTFPVGQLCPPAGRSIRHDAGLRRPGGDDGAGPQGRERSIWPPGAGGVNELDDLGTARRGEGYRLCLGFGLSAELELRKSGKRFTPCFRRGSRVSRTTSVPDTVWASILAASSFYPLSQPYRCG